MNRVKENVIEWLEGDKTALCTFSQKKFVNRIQKMAEKDGAPVEIIAKNPDGSILVKIPVSAIHLYVSAWNGAGRPFNTEGDEE